MGRETCKDNVAKDRCTRNGVAIGHEGVCQIKNCPIDITIKKINRRMAKIAAKRKIV